MSMTRASYFGGRGDAIHEAVAKTTTMGRGRARARGRAHEVAPVRGRTHRVAPSKGLIFLGLVDYDIILGMDCLFPLHVILDCYDNTVTIAMPDRDIDYAIYLELGTKPISISPYRMASAKLKKLKN
ncbi:hypothetical protein MTR67_035001 [Solanum verrucosum]|uniref:Gag-pol polyprotein n=1 Tax=Solanum verrucosum TaxID=315347 RepID=A0AAF0U9H3_SOLVR|nr:hypothetical protein MTR67_035001 [Solanum verrucosum]